MGINCVIPSLSTIRTTTLDRWSRVLGAIIDLHNNMEVTQKKNILADHGHSMSTPYIGKILYSSEASWCI